MDSLTAPVIFGIPSALLILGIVEGFKLAGLPAKYAVLVSAAVGAVLGVLSQCTPTVSSPDYAQAGVLGLYAGLIASGIYSGIVALRSRDVAPDPSPPPGPMPPAA